MNEFLPEFPPKYPRSLTFVRGEQFFELSNHLGNVLVTLADRKTGLDPNTDGRYDQYQAAVQSTTDYAPFGSTIPGRSMQSTAYRYGFNGKENDTETQIQDYGMRIYNPRVGKFLSVDPLTKDYAFLTPYQFSSNRPIDGLDLDGMEFVKTLPQFEKSGGVFDYVTEIDNAVIRLINLPLTTWNSGVTNIQSVNRGTWTQDFKSEAKQMGEGIKATAKQFYSAPITTLVSPEAIGVYTEIFIGGKVFNVGPKAGNLIKPTTSTQIAQIEANAVAGSAKKLQSLGSGRTIVKDWLANAGNIERNTMIQDIESAGFKRTSPLKSPIAVYERGKMKIRLDPPQKGTSTNHMHLEYGDKSFDVQLKSVPYKSPSAHIPIK